SARRHSRPFARRVVQGRRTPIQQDRSARFGGGPDGDGASSSGGRPRNALSAASSVSPCRTDLILAVLGGARDRLPPARGAVSFAKGRHKPPCLLSIALSKLISECRPKSRSALMKLYFAPGACSLSPHIVLREAGYNFDLEQVNNQEKKTKSGMDYWSINGKGQVPVL